MEPHYSEHAFQRANERRIEPQYVYLVVHQGSRRVQSDGTIVRELKQANLREYEKRPMAWLIGLTVILDASERKVITVYWNRPMSENPKSM